MGTTITGINANLSMDRGRAEFVLILAQIRPKTAYHRNPNVFLGHGALLNVIEDGERIVLPLATFLARVSQHTCMST